MRNSSRIILSLLGSVVFLGVSILSLICIMRVMVYISSFIYMYMLTPMDKLICRRNKCLIEELQDLGISIFITYKNYYSLWEYPIVPEISIFFVSCSFNMMMILVIPYYIFASLIVLTYLYGSYIAGVLLLIISVIAGMGIYAYLFTILEDTPDVHETQRVKRE